MIKTFVFISLYFIGTYFAPEAGSVIAILLAVFFLVSTFIDSFNEQRRKIKLKESLIKEFGSIEGEKLWLKLTSEE